jgi:outer membrane protein OmpA-like peptidoglycan-associated protein
VAALAVSGVVFFLFTKKKMEAAGDTSAAPKVEMKEPSVAVPAPPKPEPTPPKPEPPAPPPPPKFGFARPVDLGKKMADFLAAGDFESAGQLAAAGSPGMAAEAAEVFRKAVEELGFKPGRQERVGLLGVMGDKTRLSLPMTAPDGSKVDLELDLSRDPKMGWKIGELKLPKELGKALASLPVPPMPKTVAGSAANSGEPKMASEKGATAKAGVSPKPKAALPSMFSVRETPDSLSFASEFVKQLLDHQFEAAMALVDPEKVSAERLAGLCIVFEEGSYSLKPSKPLVTTVASPQVSWVIAQVESEELDQSTEFGLELKADEKGVWRVVGLNLSDILGSFARSAGKLGVPYTPIVKNPKGGESLALYFEYDSANLHPRATKQLEIVASLLKADTSKQLTINGHTDSKGSDAYNLRLSSARAESVKRKLVELGVPSPQVETQGFGKAQPLGPNERADGTDNPEGRSRNRRAEIYLDF